MTTLSGQDSDDKICCQGSDHALLDITPGDVLLDIGAEPARLDSGRLTGSQYLCVEESEEGLISYNRTQKISG
jgi:hypothetical protein